jgi:hypothetical protein
VLGISAQTRQGKYIWVKNTGMQFSRTMIQKEPFPFRSRSSCSLKLADSMSLNCSTWALRMCATFVIGDAEVPFTSLTLLTTRIKSATSFQRQIPKFNGISASKLWTNAC